VKGSWIHSNTYTIGRIAFQWGRGKDYDLDELYYGKGVGKPLFFLNYTRIKINEDNPPLYQLIGTSMQGENKNHFKKNMKKEKLAFGSILGAKCPHGREGVCFFRSMMSD